MNVSLSTSNNANAKKTRRGDDGAVIEARFQLQTFITKGVGAEPQADAPVRGGD
jgi:hypothetical protein